MKTDTYIVLCVAQMAMDGCSAAVIDFFRKIAPRLLSTGHVNGRIASELAFMTPQGAGKHIKFMTSKGYLVRKNHRKWAMPDKFIKNAHIIPLARYIYTD